MTLLSSSNRSSQNTDEQLVEAYKKTGDLKVLGDLYERYLHLCYGVCLKYLQNREDAKDAVSEIFEKLVVEVPKHDIVQFKSWLYVLVKNFCLMRLRSVKSAEKKDNRVEWNERFVESYQDLHPIDEELTEKLKKDLEDCISKLKEEQKQCIQLFYFENKSYREISSTLDLEEKKVKSFIQNGKRNLKICLDNKK